MLFKKALLAKVLDGSKVQTRRLSTRRYHVGRVYGVTCRRYQKSQAHIQITQAKQQKIGDITLEDVRKEGFNTLEEFKQTWLKINGTYDPEQLVTAYEFRLSTKISKLSFEAKPQQS
jgi:hypothetical protein